MRLSAIRLITIAGTCVLALTGVACSQSSPADDSRIARDVRSQLKADPMTRDLHVEVEEGMVTLRGRVQREETKERAEQRALAVRGVEDVDNQVYVGAAAVGAPPPDDRS